MSEGWVPPPPPQALLPGRPPVDPRFRRRWAEARREEGRQRLRRLLGLVVAVLVVGAGVGLLHTSLFRVRHVVVVGNAHTPTTAVLAAAGLGRPGQATLMVDAGSPRAVRRVDALPWVAKATFSRHWPWTLSIRLTERRPVAVVAPAVRGAKPGARPEAVVDKTGRVLEWLKGSEHQPSLPVVSGLHRAAPGQHVLPLGGLTRQQMHELLSAAAAVPSALDSRGLDLSFRSGAGLVAAMNGTRALVVLGDSGQAALKWAVLQELAHHVGLAAYRRVDLTVPDRPALTPLVTEDDT